MTIKHYEIARALKDYLIGYSRTLADPLWIKDGVVSFTNEVDRIDRIGSPILVVRIDSEEILPYKTSKAQVIFTCHASILYIVSGNKEQVVQHLSDLTDYIRENTIMNPDILFTQGIYLTYISSISAIEHVIRKETTDYVYRTLTFRSHNYS